MQAAGYLALGSAVLGFAALGLPAHAQLRSPSADPWAPPTSAGPDRVGLHPSSAQFTIGCGASLLPCGTEGAALQARQPSAFQWNLELSQLRLGTTDRLAPGSGREGLSLALVGRQPLFGSRFSVYGKLGTTYGYPDQGAGLPPALAAGPDGAYGVSFGAGVSMAVTPRLSATLGLDSHELRLGGGEREAVRALGLGLQYRY
ncbi:outer membrane protein [Ramlibacter sp.]|uniref:outer membrane protein n=1 Tax=Ramlibacter sp. TaxID=1917967 RepID=UPI002FCBB888